MSDSINGLLPDSLAIHADRAANETDAVVPPIWQTSTFWADSDESFLEKATTPGCDHFYTRTGNPNQTQAAMVVAALEGAEGAVVAGSG
ncbi:MAG: PLP-dependent transferase, partial [Blastocatellia bacterium]